MGNISNIVINHGLSPINPVQCGYENCAPSHDYGPAIRDHWLLHFVASGRGMFRTSRGEYELSAGDVFIIRPYEITYYKADNCKPWEYYWLGFSTDIPLPQALISCDVIHAPRLREIFISAFDAPGVKDTDPTVGAYEHYLCGIVWQIMAHVLAQSPASASSAEGYVRAAIDVIESEYSSDITVAELAERLHLNRSYFSVIFRRYTGMTPRDYLIDHRMRRANELLALRGYTVSVTALSVGYPDVFAFSRAYKRHFGCSPNKTRSIKN